MFRHILVPTDGSGLSAKAVAAAMKLARLSGARVTGVFAAPPPTPVIYEDFVPVGLVTPGEHARLIEKTADRYLGAIRKAAEKAGVACECVCVTNDFPADAILSVAKKRKCDLIVMASHGRKGISGVLLGSETQKVLVRSHVPVLVYR